MRRSTKLLLAVLILAFLAGLAATGATLVAATQDPMIEASRSVQVPPGWPPIPSGVVAGTMRPGPDVSAVLVEAARNVRVPPDWPPIPH